MKARELIQELVKFIDYHGDDEVEITPRIGNGIHCSRPIESISWDGEGSRGNGTIYIQCEIYEED